jgi:hypothetical protein
VGRFVSTDPFGGDTEQPRTLHRYLYVAADPVNATDPTGLEGEYIGGESILGMASLSLRAVLAAVATGLPVNTGVFMKAHNVFYVSGYYHNFIKIVPTNQTKWAASRLESNKFSTSG